MKHETIAKISAVVITLALVALLLSQIEISDVITTLADIDPLYLIAGFILYACSYFFRALRFHILLNREVGLRDLFNIVCVHNMMNNILPARTGELSYIYLIKKLHNKTTGEGIATLFVARAFDFIAISLLFFISVWMIQDLPDIIMKAIWVIAFLMVFIVVFLVAMLYFGESFFNIVRRFFRRFNLEEKYFVDYLLRKGEETVESLGVVKSKRVVMMLTMTSVGIWCFIYLTTYFILNATAIQLGIWMLTVVATLPILTTVLPIQSLGGFGVSEASWTVGLILFGFTKEISITTGFVVHIVSFVYILILGCYGLLTNLKT